MQDYEDNDSPFGLISSVYSLGTATLFLIIALYCTHFMKQEERAMEDQQAREENENSNTERQDDELEALAAINPLPKNIRNAKKDKKHKKHKSVKNGKST